MSLKFEHTTPNPLEPTDNRAKSCVFYTLYHVDTILIPDILICLTKRMHVANIFNRLVINCRAQFVMDYWPSNHRWQAIGFHTT